VGHQSFENLTWFLYGKSEKVKKVLNENG